MISMYCRATDLHHIKYNFNVCSSKLIMVLFVWMKCFIRCIKTHKLKVTNAPQVSYSQNSECVVNLHTVSFYRHIMILLAHPAVARETS